MTEDNVEYKFELSCGWGAFYDYVDRTCGSVDLKFAFRAEVLSDNLFHVTIIFSREDLTVFALRDDVPGGFEGLLARFQIHGPLINVSKISI